MRVHDIKEDVQAPNGVPHSLHRWAITILGFRQVATPTNVRVDPTYIFKSTNLINLLLIDYGFLSLHEVVFPATCKPPQYRDPCRPNSSGSHWSWAARFFKLIFPGIFEGAIGKGQKNGNTHTYPKTICLETMTLKTSSCTTHHKLCNAWCGDSILGTYYRPPGVCHQTKDAQICSSWPSKQSLMLQDQLQNQYGTYVPNLV